MAPQTHTTAAQLEMCHKYSCYTHQVYTLLCIRQDGRYARMEIILKVFNLSVKTGSIVYWKETWRRRIQRYLPGQAWLYVNSFSCFDFNFQLFLNFSLFGKKREAVSGFPSILLIWYWFITYLTIQRQINNIIFSLVRAGRINSYSWKGFTTFI